MSALQEVGDLLASMTRAEKARLLQWVVRDLGDAFPGIDSTPGVCGGEPCIVRTRIPVWVLVQARRLGTSEADLLRCYPTLRAEDLVNAWAYFRAHSNEIEQQIRDNEGHKTWHGYMRTRMLVRPCQPKSPRLAQSQT
jgi:uncharacterized protein (DUF433 family)